VAIPVARAPQHHVHGRDRSPRRPRLGRMSRRAREGNEGNKAGSRNPA
jgi:hypothetical protein